MNLAGNDRLRVRSAVVEDVALLAPLLRADDIAEVQAANGCDGAEALREGLRHSQICLFATYDGQPLAMFGVGCDDNSPDVGVPWMLGSDLLAACPVSMLRLSKLWMAEFLCRYSALCNYVKADHWQSISYLSHLGFSFDDPVSIGPNGDRFLPFSYHLNEGV